MATQIMVADKNRLSFEGDRLATKEEYMMCDRTIGSIFESLKPGESIQLQEGVFKLDEDLDPIQDPTQVLDYSGILKKAYEWGQENHSESNNYRHAAFANSVAYLMTGLSGGYGGPSIREHCCSWALAGASGSNTLVETNLGKLTMQFPDGSLPRAGNWNFQQACQFCEPICYGDLPAIAAQILQQEHCFDDDPADLEALQRK